MRTLLSLSSYLIAALCCVAQTNNLFYYGFADPVQLTVVPGKYTVEFNEPGGQAYLHSSGLTATQLSPKTFEVTAALSALTAASQGHFAFNPVYAVAGGTKLYILNKVVLRWKNGVSETTKTSIRTQYGLVLEKTTRLYDLYLTNSPLSVSKLIYESGHVIYSQPEFIAPVEKHEHIPNDAFFGQQFYLHNTGQQCNDGLFGTADADIDAPEAWDITFGNSSVVVAVVDEGVTSDHPDLPNTRQLRLPGSNFAAPYDGSDPDDPSPNAPTNENHGNACAGIVGAEIDNNEGIAGIAPGCTVMPVKVRFGIGLTFTNFADAVTFAADNGADVISCSWGANTPLNNIDASVITAISDAIDNGVVVFFSAGNTANHVSSNIGFVGFPGNANIPLLLTIVASDRNDVQANYSPTDTEMDLSAPSHTAYFCQIPTEGFNVWTLDIPGNPGYNPHHDDSNTTCDNPPNGNLTEELPASGTNYWAYTGRMGGTSAATPEVAAIAALMLSVNPCLSVAQIHDILIGTAEQVGGYDYAWNSSDLGHSIELGHGRANAYLAVVAAQGAYSATPDIYSKDVADDFGLEPDLAVDMPWLSEDIWVRNLPDGTTNQEHENPEYSMTDPVYVYVRVRNKSCVSTGSEPVKLYWAKAATALTWPQYWDGSITTPALMGAPIGTVNAPPLGPGEEAILEFTWSDVPNPADYNGINNEPWHFCLLSRIDSPNDPMFDEQWAGTWNLGYNVVQNNNIVWKNISIVDIVPGIGGGGWPDDKLMGATVAIGNATSVAGKYAIELSNPTEYSGRAITDVAEVRVTMDEATWLKWEQGGRQAVNLEVSREERFQLIVTGSPARLGNLHYAPHERSLMDVSFNFLTRELSGKSEFLYNAVQRDQQTNAILGGEQYVIRMPSREGFEADGGDDKEVLRNATVQLHAEDIAEDAIYNWYGPDGELLHTGKDLTVTADMTKQYKLEVIAQADGVKDYDQVEVKMKPASLTSVYPNPAAETATIGYNAQECTSAYLMITIPYTGVTNNYILNLENTARTIDVSNFPPGAYGVILVADGEMVDEIGLVVVQ